MRTTVTIADELHASAKLRARERGVTLSQFIEDALRRELSVDYASAERPPVPIFRGGKGVRPGLDLTSNRAIYEFLDEGVDLDKRR